MKYKEDIQAAFYKAHVISSTEFENMLLGFVLPAVLLITVGYCRWQGQLKDFCWNKSTVNE